MDKNPIDALLIKIIDQKANKDEVAQFEEWHNTSEENQQYYKKFRVIWEKTGDVYKNKKFDMAGAKSKISEKINKKQTKRKTRRLWQSAAAAILLISIISWPLIKNNSLTGLETYASANEVLEIMLPDSSLVWLNANSTLEAPIVFKNNKRTVKLKGEAFFQVKPNKKAPFKVLAGKTTTEVLGTSFNINHIDTTGYTQMNVASGKVAFYKTRKGHTGKVLAAGEMGVFNPVNATIAYSSNNNANYLSWKTGTIEFKDTPIVEVCAVLSKHYNKIIKTNIKDPEVILTGKFENEKLENILNLIKITLNVKIKTTEKQILIYKN